MLLTDTETLRLLTKRRIVFLHLKSLVEAQKSAAMSWAHVQEFNRTETQDCDF